VYALIVTEELPDWEDSQRIGRRRKWFPVEEAAALLAAYKPIERTYLQMYCDRKNCPSSAGLNSSNSRNDAAAAPVPDEVPRVRLASGGGGCDDGLEDGHASDVCQ
jgi:hypothetical protein